jgi:CHAT domain-containing protein
LVGDELIGLVRAFLGAGASTLGVSLWLVQDNTTAWLMEKYYERLRDGAGPAAAIRTAQLALKEQFPHPYYWAPFVLIGQR